MTDLKIYSVLDVATTGDELIEIQVIVLDGVVVGITIPANDRNPRHVPVDSLDWISLGDPVKGYRQFFDDYAYGHIPFSGNIIEYDLSKPYIKE